MVRRNTYRLGDNLVISDRSGMTRYRSQMRMTWDGLFVDADEWNPREAQDFVRGIPDDQSVPISRPDVKTSVGETTLSSAATRNANSVILTSVTGIADRDTIGILLDDATVHWTFSDGDPSGSTVTLGSFLPGNAASGNTVYLNSINDRTFITATGISAEDL